MVQAARFTCLSLIAMRYVFVIQHDMAFSCNFGLRAPGCCFICGSDIYCDGDSDEQHYKGPIGCVTDVVIPAVIVDSVSSRN